jgi:hypothetical protein
MTADAARMSWLASPEVRHSQARQSAFFGFGGGNFAEKGGSPILMASRGPRITTGFLESYFTVKVSFRSS